MQNEIYVKMKYYFAETPKTSILIKQALIHTNPLSQSTQSKIAQN